MHPFSHQAPFPVHPLHAKAVAISSIKWASHHGPTRFFPGFLVAALVSAATSAGRSNEKEGGEEELCKFKFGEVRGGGDRGRGV